MLIENARLNERALEQERVRRDSPPLAAESATAAAHRASHGGILPEVPPAVSLPCAEHRRRLLRLHPGGGPAIGIALADVSGKGIAAALIDVVVQASLRIIASDGEVSLPQWRRSERVPLPDDAGQQIATFFYAQVDADRRQLRYVNAGHNPPLLVRRRRIAICRPCGRSREVHELTVGGAVVGMLPGMTYEEATVDLKLRRRAPRVHRRRQRGARPGRCGVR